MKPKPSTRVGELLSPPQWLLLGGTLLLAAIAFAQIHVGHHLRHSPEAPVEISTDLLAAIGFAWAAIQLRAHWKRALERKAWLFASGGMFLIWAAESAEWLSPLLKIDLDREWVTAALWGLAACGFFFCGRVYAMRRGVFPVLQMAFAVQVIAHGSNVLVEAGLITGTHTAKAIDTAGDAGELVVITAYIGALLLTQLGPLKSYLFPEVDLGRKARAIFDDFGLKSAVRYPTPYRALDWPVLRSLVTGAMILWYGLRIGPLVRAASGFSLAGQIWDLTRLGFGAGIDAVSYYHFSLFSRVHGEENEVVTRRETKNGLFGALSRQRRGNAPRSDLNDKLAVWHRCEEAGIASAPILALVDRDGAEFFGPPEILDRDLFVKTRRGRGGKFTATYLRVAPLRYRTHHGSEIGLGDMIAGLEVAARRGDLLIEPALENHPEIADLASDALIVFRVVTCLDERGEPRITHGLIRLMARFEPHWPHGPDGEFGGALDLFTGEIRDLTGDAPQTSLRRFRDHPVTGQRIAGRRVSGWPALAALAIEAHRLFADRVVIGWDMAWTPEGPVILEGNSNMDVAFIQRCYATSLGRSPLAPLLTHHLDRLVAAQLQARGMAGQGARQASGPRRAGV